MPQSLFGLLRPLCDSTHYREVRDGRHFGLFGLSVDAIILVDAILGSPPHSFRVRAVSYPTLDVGDSSSINFRRSCV